MDEFLDLAPEVNVPEAEYKRLLGYPADYEVDGRVSELIEKTRKWYAENGRPWVYVRQACKLELMNGRFRIDGIDFTSKRLYDQLAAAEAHNVMLVAVSAGKQCEARAGELWQEEKPDEYFFMEMFGSAVVENLVTTTGARICEWVDQHNMAVLPHYSPGYPEWDIAEQQKLFDLIRQSNGPELPGEISVMESGMLNPKKSLLAVFGITSRLDKVQNHLKLVPCENCSLEPCQYRRVPYKRSVQQKLTANNVSENGYGNGSTALGLDHHAAYKINTKALQKWSKERLMLKVLNDRSIEAQFRYEGTTCSNTGRPLEFIYRVKLAPSDQHYKIMEAYCLPAPGDTGHTYMCQYTRDAAQLMASIESEKPLLGEPLNLILNWKYQANPAGCYCTPASREHKWGIVFQVIHFAMVQHVKEGAAVESPR